MKTEKLEKHYSGIVEYEEEYLIAKKLDSVQLQEILKYVKKLNDTCIEEVYVAMKENPQLNQDFENWASHHMGYIESAKVLDLIIAYLEVKDSQQKSKQEQTPQKQIENKDILTLQPEKKPTFKTDSLQTIIDILNPYFPQQQNELRLLLETGEMPSTKLLFNGSAITLLDFFKQLIAGQFLTIPIKKDLEKWISEVFCATYRGNPFIIKAKYASRVISERNRAAKGKRLANVKEVNGKWQLVPDKINNREQN